MFPGSFSYHRPSSVAEAVQLLAGNPDAKILAGGHSLIPAMKLRLAMPGALVDIGHLDELKGVRLDGDLRIGAGTTYDELRDAPGVGETYPIFGEAIHVIGDQQVRAHGTIGGSLAHADPAADLTAVVLALGGSVTATGPNGERTIAVDGLFVDLWTTSLEPEEVVTSISIPAPASGTRMAYEKHSHPASGYAVVGIAAVVVRQGESVTSARIAVTGATSKAVRLESAESALVGNILTAETIGNAASAAPHGLEINGDHYASEEYRSHLVSLLTRKALERIAAA